MQPLHIFLVALLTAVRCHTPYGGGRGAKYEETVAELLSHVEAEYKQPCEMILHGREFTFSQVWQDWSIFHNYFKSHTLRWGGGTYVDIGTNQPTVISNTIFFDKCLGWKGVCFEPQSRYHAWIKRTRGCTLVPSCVLGSDKGVVSFKGATGGSAALKTASTDDPEAMRCVVAKPILESLNVSSVDLLNIDIEGAEPSVLRCFPFDEFKVGAVLMETALFSGADFAPLNLFFHRHNFMNADTFVSRWTKDRPLKEQQMAIQDHVFVRKSKPTIWPPNTVLNLNGRGAPHATWNCSKLDAKYRIKWCGPANYWGNPHKDWGPCPA